MKNNNKKHGFGDYALTLIMNGVNLLQYGIYLVTHNMVISFVILFIDVLLLVFSVKSIKDDKMVGIINSLLALLATIGTVLILLMSFQIVINIFK